MKKLALILALSVMSSVVMAQPPASNQPTVLQPVAPAEYVLKIKPADVDKIGKGLGMLPFNDVAELMQILRQQIIEQQQPPK